MIVLNRKTLEDKIHACWLGKNIGGTIGAPFEGKRQLNDITGYTTAEGVIVPNDDLDLQLIWLKAVEEYGPHHLNANVLGEYWINYIPPHWNEYGIGKNNMRRGMLPPMAGEYENAFWKHSNGAWIRTEVWACMAPGCPDVAVKYAMEDACVDHGMGEGTYAAMFVAALEAAAFVERDIRRLIDIGLSKIPAECRMASHVRLLLDCADQGLDWKTTREKLLSLTMSDPELGWFEAPANVCFALLGLLWGGGDFKKSMIIAVNCGDDTDCTGATIGALMGILGGSACIPEDWAAHIGDAIVAVYIDRGSLMTGLPASCTELSERIIAQQPAMFAANGIKNIRISDEADSADPEDLAALSGGSFAKRLCERRGYSYQIDFIWGSAEVVFDGAPDILPGGTVHVTVIFRNNLPDPKHLDLRWLCPEGFTVTGARSNLYLSHVTAETTGEASVSVEIHAGDKTSPMNRVVLEAAAIGRPNVGYIPITMPG